MPEELQQKQALEEYVLNIITEKLKGTRELTSCWSEYNLVVKVLGPKFDELKEYCSHIPTQENPSLEESELVAHVLSEINPLLIHFDDLVLEFYSSESKSIPKNMDQTWKSFWTSYNQFRKRTNVKLHVLKSKITEINWYYSRGLMQDN